MAEKIDKDLVLSVKDLNYRYPSTSTLSLENISFSLKAQTVNMIIGPNGSGKSTLIKVILGILDSNSQINFYDNGKKISSYQAHIGYVPQKRNIDTTIPITVNEFLSLTQKSCKRCVSNVETETVDVLNKVNAIDYRYRKLGDLSGGQLQRIILARALLHHPKILVLDEPEAGIDIQGERFFYEVLQKLVKEQGITALIATHEMEVVSQYATQVLCLNKTLVCTGTAKQTMTKETFSKLYGIDTKPYHHSHHHYYQEESR